MVLFLKGEVSTCREAPPSTRSHPLAELRPSRAPSPPRPLSSSVRHLPFRGTFPQCHTANVSVYQNLSVPPPCVPRSETPHLSDSTSHCDPSSQRDSSSQCGPALISVTPLSRFRPPSVGIRSASLRREEELQLASTSAQSPKCALHVSGPCAVAVPDASGSL